MSAKGTGKVEGSTCTRCVLTLPTQSVEDLIKSGKHSAAEGKKDNKNRYCSQEENKDRRPLK